MGTDDRTLIRVVVTRCEVDMKQIKTEFQNRYNQSLEAFIRVSHYCWAFLKQIDIYAQISVSMA